MGCHAKVIKSYVFNEGQHKKRNIQIIKFVEANINYRLKEIYSGNGIQKDEVKEKLYSMREFVLLDNETFKMILIRTLGDISKGLKIDDDDYNELMSEVDGLINFYYLTVK